MKTLGLPMMTRFMASVVIVIKLKPTSDKYVDDGGIGCYVNVLVLKNV